MARTVDITNSGHICFEAFFFFVLFSSSSLYSRPLTPMNLDIVLAFCCFLLQAIVGHSLLQTRSLWRCVAPVFSLVSIYICFNSALRPPMQPLYPFSPRFLVLQF
jgi:hypothetical protein